MTMKNIFLFIFFLCSSLIKAQGGIIVPPESVRTAFEQMYANKIAVWSIEYGNKIDDVRFEAKFNVTSKTKGYALYDQKGVFRSFREQISMTKLPKNAKLYLDKNYPIMPIKTKVKSKIKNLPAREVFFVTDAQNVIAYEVKVRNESKNYKAIFDADGNYINKVQIN